MTCLGLHRPAPERPGRRVVAVPGRRRPVADLRRHAHRQLRARLVLHARASTSPYTLVERARARGALGFWPALLLAALAVGVLGALVEVLLLRRIYRAPELFQLLATFALVLVIKDAALWLWGPEDLLGPRAPGLRGLGRRSSAAVSRPTTCS